MTDEEFLAKQRDFAQEVSCAIADIHKRYPELPLEAAVQNIGWVIGATVGVLRPDFSDRVTILQQFMRNYRLGFEAADSGDTQELKVN